MDCWIQRTEMLRLLHPTDTYSRDGNQRTNNRTLVFFPIQFQSKKRGSNPPSWNSPRSAPQGPAAGSNSLRRPLRAAASSSCPAPPCSLMMELDPRLYENVVRSLLHALPSSVEGAIILFSLIRQTPSLYRD